MRNAVRVVKAMIAVAAALILVAPAAQANVLDEIVDSPPRRSDGHHLAKAH